MLLDMAAPAAGDPWAFLGCNLVGSLISSDNSSLLRAAGLENRVCLLLDGAGEELIMMENCDSFRGDGCKTWCALGCEFGMMDVVMSETTGVIESSR